MKFNVYQISTEWVERRNGATIISLGEITAESLIEAIKEARKTYPKISLRVSNGKNAIEVRASLDDNDAYIKTLEEYNIEML